MFAENDIMFEIRKLHLLIKREFEIGAKLAQKMPTRLQAAIILFVCNNQKKGVDTFQKDLEKKFSVRASTVTALIQNMEKSEFIARVNTEKDGRLKKIILTQNSEKLLQELKVRAKAIKAKLLQGIISEDMEAFMKLLRKLQNNLEEQNGKNTI